MSKKIPFRISARTARLIGRQNFPNAEGAIIELVKNSYDADAPVCILIFDNKYMDIPPTLSLDEFKHLAQQEDIIKKHYKYAPNADVYLYAESSEEDAERLRGFFQSQCAIYIIDNGEGMTDKVIEKYWMLIGTANKRTNSVTKNGRIKTGEKGIGRFALDKLGDVATMLTAPAPSMYSDVAPETAFLWRVDWSEFDGRTKALNEIEADLEKISRTEFQQYIHAIFEQFADTFAGDNQMLLSPDMFSTGTIIKISGLRDKWDDAALEKLFYNLETLIPPREENAFDVFLISTLNAHKYGQISSPVLDDYDYKVEAHVNQNGKVEITIFRKEFDYTRFPDKLLRESIFHEDGFKPEDFERGWIRVERTVAQLVPGLKDVDKNDVLNNIGAFEFVFYFMKMTANKQDKSIFLYKDFRSAHRKAWFSKFGGIKLFRDNFRVRPYGETGNSAFDWLMLGQRAAKSPSSIGQIRKSSWKVRPNQISGIINISRLTNVNFEDTSSRYGLQENRAFQYFKQIILGILSVFEDDRSKIGQALKAFHNKQSQAISREQQRDVKERVKSLADKVEKTQPEEDAVTLLKLNEHLESQIEEIQNESKMLASLASVGLVVSSFAHELRNIKDNLGYRIDELRELIQGVIAYQKIETVPDFKNPFTALDAIKKEDQKMAEWLRYALEMLKKDKRRRREQDLMEYFDDFRKTWAMACSTRGVHLSIDAPDKSNLKLKIFVVDLDTIFNNLLINSFDAFRRKDAPPGRNITIRLEAHESDLHIIYTDSGPGLSDDIVNPDKIFEPLFTTKRDAVTGEDIGIGLGMWLVKTSVEDNHGEVKLLNNPTGFGLEIIFPKR